MEEEISRIKSFLNEFNDQIQSPTSEELSHVRIANYSLEPGDVPWQVIDWVLNYLENKNCPHSLALSMAKEAAHQVSASVAELCLTETESDEKSFNSSTLYAEAITKLPAICNSFLSNQANLKPSCKSKFATSVFSIKNKRRKMEDRHVIYHDFNTLLDLKDAPYHSYYAVFDGHSGVDAASYAAAQLHINIAKHPDFLTDTAKAIIEGYQITDLNFLNKCNKWNIKSGCTAVSALIRDNTVYLAWLGDSQAVLVKGGAPVLITSPHKPDREDEKHRIENLGGHISHMGTWRVNGLLAVTRAIGDPDQKRFISGEPELSVVDLDGTEDFLILACDGLWDGLSPEDVTGVLYRHVESSSPDEPLDSIAAKLVHQSKLLGSEDNITVIVVFLRDLEDIKKDASKFISNSYSVLNQDFMSMNGSMKTHSAESAGDNSFSKPTVLELNSASSKKLKNAANVMSSAGIGAAAYSYQYVENTSEIDFHSSAMSSSQNAFHSHAVKPSCFPPEATALSELPTPPIDDMLASQQFENFYSTDLYKEMSSSMHASQTDSSNIPVDTDLLSKEVSSPANQESSTQPVESIVDNVSKLSLIDTENEDSANPLSDASPDDAVGIASTVVTTAIENAVKCISSTEAENPNPSQSQLNPYAKPFVMKSFFNTEESVTSSFVSSDICDASFNSTEELKANVSNPFLTDSLVDTCSSQLLPDSENLEQLAGDKTNPCAAGSEVIDFIPKQQVVDSVFEKIESINNTRVENDTILNLQSNNSEQFLNQAVEISNITSNVIKTEMDSDFTQKDSIYSATETDKLMNSDNVQKLSTFEESKNCMIETVTDTSNQEIVEENMPVTAEPLIESLVNVDEAADSSFISNKTHAVDNLPVSNLSKESEMDIISPADPPPETLEPQLFSNPFLSSSNTEHSSENNENSEALQMVMEFTADNTSVISETESKCEVSESVIDNTVENHPSQTSHESDNLTNKLLSNVNTEDEMKPEYSVQEPNISSSSIELGLPVGGSVNEVITPSKNIISDIQVESKVVESFNVDNIEKSTVVTSQLVESISSEPISLIDIKNELIPSEAEVPSDPSVEDSHAEAVAVDLKSLPVGIPEAEGVTEDIDSDSEKDGGWSYMKVNTVNGSKSKPEGKPSKTPKSNEAKPSSASKGKTISRPNLEVKNKMKSAVGDRMKNTSTDKTKSLVTEKSKVAAAVDKTKTISADKSKTVSATDKATKNLTVTERVRKPIVEKKPDIKPKLSKFTTSTPLTKTASDKPTKSPGVSTVKKEASETVKITSTTAKSPRPTTLMRTNVPGSKPISTSTVDRSVGSSKISAKSKVGTTVSENKTATKSTTITSTLSKGTSGQIKPSTTSRITATRPTATVPAKTSTIAKSTLMKSSTSETKPKPQSSTVSTVKRTVTSTIKKSEMKEVKDNVNINKQISAKKTTAVNKVESSSNLTSRRVMSANTKSTISRVANSAAKSDGSKKDIPKVSSQKLASKNIASKALQESSKKEDKKDESAQKTEEAKNTLNLENDQKNASDNDQKNAAEIEQITDEKFILETSSKEITKETCEVSVEEKILDGNLTSAAFAVEDKSPTGECSSESL